MSKLLRLQAATTKNNTQLLPGVLRLSRNPSLVPVISFISEFLSSILELVVYRGLNAPPRDHSKYLEEFEPEQSEENVSVLNKALRCREKEDRSGEIRVELTQ